MFQGVEYRIRLTTPGEFLTGVTADLETNETISFFSRLLPKWKFERNTSAEVRNSLQMDDRLLE